MTATWRDQAKCRGTDTRFFFGNGGEIAIAKRFCTNCPVITQCLTDALNAGPSLTGVYGGTDETQRRRILRNPDHHHLPEHPPEVRAEALDLWQRHRPHYAADGACARTIGKRIGADHKTVLRWVRAADLAPEPKRYIRTATERADIVQDYLDTRDQHATATAAMDATAALHGISRAALRDWLREAGLIAVAPRGPRNRRKATHAA